MELVRLSWISEKRKAESRVEKASICKAVDALLKWLSSKSSQRPRQLIEEDDEFLYLLISLRKIPDQTRVSPHLIPLPHPLFSPRAGTEVCLIVNDLSRGLQKKEAKQRILEEGLGISRVIGLRKLQTDYKTYEAKRKLFGSYDLFLADDRILARLPQVLGKTFMKKKKHPIPVKLTRTEWKGQIEAACGSSCMYIRGGTCSMFKVARISQTREEIIDNVVAAIEGAAEAVPKKWKNLGAIYLKSAESVALPLYQVLPDRTLKVDSGLQQPVGVARKADDLQPVDDSCKFSRNKLRKRYIDTE